MLSFYVSANYRYLTFYDINISKICIILENKTSGRLKVNKNRYLKPKHDLFLTGNQVVKKETEFERRKETRKLQLVCGLQKCTMPTFILWLWLNLT